MWLPPVCSTLDKLERGCPDWWRVQGVIVYRSFWTPTPFLCKVYLVHSILFLLAPSEEYFYGLPSSRVLFLLERTWRRMSHPSMVVIEGLFTCLLYKLCFVMFYILTCFFFLVMVILKEHKEAFMQVTARRWWIFVVVSPGDILPWDRFFTGCSSNVAVTNLHPTKIMASCVFCYWGKKEGGMVKMMWLPPVMDLCSFSLMCLF